MYDVKDPRSVLAATPAKEKRPANAFAAAEYARFYQSEPVESGPAGETWYARGQNFVLALTKATPGAEFTRKDQPDEYVVVIRDPDTPIEVAANGETASVPGFSLVIVPPGDSTVTVPNGGELVRLFTVRSADLAAKCENADAYAEAHPNIPPFEPWPEPPGGFKIRQYSLDVPKQDGRFGRIFRCTTFMVNYLDEQIGPRDITALSPHFHDDFEQCSLALHGAFMHHIRWPWTKDMNTWRDDDHEHCGSPSIAVIPPPAIHTTRAVDEGENQLVDIFCPPRSDFSKQPGWVLNADDYPMPANGSGDG
ncbi:MAG TPA: hypothetical protein VM325_14885 [Alphaproteobacteria bacterium]|nr:hypothetical protein [Alphaproteobacteria bacterium]